METDEAILASLKRIEALLAVSIATGAGPRARMGSQVLTELLTGELEPDQVVRRLVQRGPGSGLPPRAGTTVRG